jgi:ParB family chromosome partitioning protein
LCRRLPVPHRYFNLPQQAHDLLSCIRQKRDDGGIGKTLSAYIRRADGGTLSRLLVETSILLVASRSNPATVLRDAASAYKMGTDAIALKVKQEFAAKEKSKKSAQSTSKTAKKAA